MYKKVLLAYDGSIEGRRALREGAKLAQLCCAEVFLLAVVELSSIMTPEAGLTIPIDEQTANYKAILAEGVERLKSLGFSPTARLEIGDAGQKIAEVAEEIEAHLVVVGHRPQGPPIPDYHESTPLRHDQGSDGRKPPPDEDVAPGRYRDGPARTGRQPHAHHEHRGRPTAPAAM